MSKMKSMLGLATIMAAMGNYGKPRSRFEEEDFETKEIKKVIPNGCQEYSHRGMTVIATSEKSAIKKINKRLDR
jgi:hypothetical protein